MENIEQKRVADRLEEMDQAIYGWAKYAIGQLKRRLLSMGVSERIEFRKLASRVKVKRIALQTRIVADPNLIPSLGYRIGKQNLEIEYVAFIFARHGIFLDRGVGYGRRAGSPKANAAEKPWLRLEMPPLVEALADTLEAEYADIAAAALVVKIPGIYNTTVTGQSQRPKIVKQRVVNPATDLEWFSRALAAEIREMQSRGARNNFK